MTSLLKYSHYFVSFDKTPIHYNRFPSSQDPIANLLILHGAGEHADRYDEFASFLAGHQIEVTVMDFRGYGQSSGSPAYAGSFKDFANDLELISRHIQRQNPMPLFLLGHSFGGLVASWCLACHTPLKTVQGLILSSPCFGLTVKVHPLRRWTAMVLAFLWPTFLHQTGVHPEHLSHDPEILKKYMEDKMILRVISSRLFYLMTKHMAQSLWIARRIEHPVLILQAGEDKVVDAKASETFYHEIPHDNKLLRVYPGLNHEILNEPNRKTIFFEILNWLKKML